MRQASAWSALALGLTVACLFAGASGQVLGRRVVYVTNWAQYRTGYVGAKQCQWVPANLPAALATHVNYAFIGVGTDMSLNFTDWRDEELIAQTQALKQRNPALKTLVALGGWSFSNPGWSQPIFGDMVASPANRAWFVQNLLAFCARYGFDGVDWDWEYPGTADRGGRLTDKAGLAAVVHELRAAATAAGRPTFLITMAVASCPYGCEGTDVRGLTPYLDWFNLMTFDYNGAWAAKTGYVAPWVDASRTEHVSATLDYYMRKNAVPASKINLGINLYGRAWYLAPPAPARAGPGAAAIAFQGPAGACTKEAGYLAWFEVKQMIALGARVMLDAAAKSAYLQQGSTWVSFDLPQTIFLKTQAAKALGLGGLMAWDASMDDAEYSLLTQMAMQTDPGPYQSQRLYTLQVGRRLAAFQARQQVGLYGKAKPEAITRAQRAALQALAAGFAGVPAAAIDASATTKGSILLTWIKAETAAAVLARGARRFAVTPCPTPPLLTQARAFQRVLPAFKVIGFNLLGPADNLKQYFPLSAVKCTGKALATAADGVLATAAAQAHARLVAPVVSRVAAAPGTTQAAWFSQLRAAVFGPHSAE